MKSDVVYLHVKKVGDYHIQVGFLSYFIHCTIYLYTYLITTYCISHLDDLLYVGKRRGEEQSNGIGRPLSTTARVSLSPLFCFPAANLFAPSYLFTQHNQSSRNPKHRERIRLPGFVERQSDRYRWSCTGPVLSPLFSRRCNGSQFFLFPFMLCSSSSQCIGKEGTRDLRFMG